MRRLVIPGGSYAECWPDGRYIVLCDMPRRVQTEAFGAVAIPPHVETLLYLRGDLGESFAGVNHADHAWEYTGFEWHDRGLACGVNAVIYRPGGELLINPVGCPFGSQGFRFFAGDRLWTGDDTYNGSAINGLAEWTQIGDVAIGQSYVAGDAATFFYRGERRILEAGYCRFIVMHRSADNLAVACWKMQENVAVLLWLTVDEISGLPLEQAVPRPPPLPPEPIPMQMPDRVKAIVQALYERHVSLAEGTDDQRRELTMLCAQQASYEMGERWGTKRASLGRPLSKDAIAYFDGMTLWSADCFNGSTRTPSVPDELEVLTGQVFVPVLPINHLAVRPQPLEHVYDGGDNDTGTCDRCGKPKADPIHIGVQPPPPPPSVDLSAILKRLDALEAENRKPMALKSAHGKYVCAESDGRLVADRPSRGSWERFEVERG